MSDPPNVATTTRMEVNNVAATNRNDKEEEPITDNTEPTMEQQTQKILENMQPNNMTVTPSPLMSSVATVVEDVPKDRECIIEFAENYSVDLASERFNLPKGTIKTWLKNNKIPIKPVYNSPGQGRKISYSRDLDNQIADHIRSLLEKGDRISVQEMCTYARSLVQKENPEFTASTGWAQRFLTRHNIDLSNHLKRLMPSPRSHGNSLNPTSDARGRPLSYSSELDNGIADWVRHRTDAGDVVTNSELRRYAKEIICKETSSFTGSASWAQNFLLRHRLSLQPTFLSTAANTNEKSELSIPISSSTTPSTNELTGIGTSSRSISTTNNNNDTILNTTSSLPHPVEDTVSSTLALLAGEGLPVETQLTQAALSLSDLTSDAALADLLNSTQDPATAPFTTSSLESSAAAYISLGQHLSELVGSVAAGSNSGQNVLESLTNSPQPLPPHSSTPVNNNNNTEVVGSGTRPLSYTKETDQQLANWVKDQQALGLKVTFASLRAHAKKVVSNENPNFNASVGWVTPFLLRHNLDLKVNDRKIRATRKTTHPRKLSAKDGQNGDEITEIPPEDSSIEESEIEITSLSIITPTSDNNNSFVGNNPGEIPQQGEVTMVTTPETSGIEELVTPPTFKGSFKLGGRSRHTLAEKLEVIRLMRQYNLAGHYISRLLGIATSTLSGWVKLVDSKGDELVVLSTNRKRSNRSGQGRPLTYSKEKDEIIASWVRKQQEEGVPVTAADLSMYASTIIGQENPGFVASVGWRHKFLQRHNLTLQQLHASYKPNNSSSSSPLPPSNEEQQIVPIPVQTEEVCTDDFTVVDVQVVEKVYPPEILHQLAEWTREKIAEGGSLQVQVFCKYAEELIVPIDALFVATLGWAFKFLHSHGIFLDPKPVTNNSTNDTNNSSNRKRSITDAGIRGESVSKKVPSFPSIVNTIAMNPDAISISPSTGNLCKALLTLSSQQEEQEAVVMETVTMETPSPNAPIDITNGGVLTGGDSSSKNYFNKTARDFSAEEKEEVVRYANATTLQKAALRYGVAAPTVWRWRMELKLHQPKYTANQKKYIVKFAETNSLKEASHRFGITTKTIQNWRRALQLDGTLSDVEIAAIAPPLLHEVITSEGEGLTTPTSSGLMTEEVIPLDNSHFQYVVDGGEVAEGNRIQGQPNTMPSTSSLELTHEDQVQDVGMEYDVISSEGHAAKPRCTREEKNHILQYALEHSIREASVKYGVSPGTLYYWKKNHTSTTANTQGLSKGESDKGRNDRSIEESPTVVNVPMTMDILAAVNNNDTLHHALTGGTGNDNDLLVGDSNVVPTNSLINAITQTLASATPEQLQSLQQITSDLNLLQAVTSLINSHDSQLRQTTLTEGGGRESLSGGISSPTDVLVSFNHATTPANHIVTETVEEVATMTTTPVEEEEVMENNEKTQDS